MRYDRLKNNPDPTLISPRIRADEHWIVAKSCLYHEPVRQAHGPSIFLGVLRSGVSLSNPQVLDGSVTHHECSYEPRVDTCASHVTSAQDRMCLDYFVGSGLMVVEKEYLCPA